MTFSVGTFGAGIQGGGSGGGGGTIDTVARSSASAAQAAADAAQADIDELIGAAGDVIQPGDHVWADYRYWKNDTAGTLTVPASPTEVNMASTGFTELGTGGNTIEIQAEQAADFTATAGSNGVVHEWPCDVRTYSTSGGVMIVTAPATPSEGDTFAVFDSRLECGATRWIRVDFVDPLMTIPNDFAVINTTGGRIEFTYIDATIGWRIIGSPNE